jgi:hypothetical protein
MVFDTPDPRNRRGLFCSLFLSARETGVTRTAAQSADATDLSWFSARAELSRHDARHGQTNEVLALQAKLKAKTKVEVVRRGLRLLKEMTDRESLREAYRRASLATRDSLTDELIDLDPLAAEGIDEP